MTLRRKPVDLYADVYDTLVTAQEAVEHGSATLDQRELVQEWGHASRFAAACDRKAPGLGWDFLVDSGWLQPEK